MGPGQTRYGLQTLRKRDLTLNGINLWGLLGILLALLCTFMVYSSPTHNAIAADRFPAVNATSKPRALREDAIRITVMADGIIYFRNRRVVPEELSERIRESVANGAERKIYMVVDNHARYSSAEKVIDQIRAAGVHDVIFLTDQPVIHR